VSRFDSGHPDLNLDEMELSTAVFESVNTLREDAVRAGSEVSVHVEGRPTGNWDRTRIAQVCTNLLSNAIKYGAGKPIEIRLWGNGESAYLSVADHGIGVPAEQQSRIFGRFERAVSARHYGGLGLGLYICRQIVEAHGGTISLTSTQGRGTTFLVMLPNTRSLATP
ncbi:MAG TPA: HAMP domain-containing sensor histidine kinase, partial [Polyangium sp.]|nr:HAMP domain-containing sensor histidine kinase [Polyangium sp.]